jgi:hypothetical protein
MMTWILGSLPEFHMAFEPVDEAQSCTKIVETITCGVDF